LPDITFVPLIGTGEDNGQAQIVLLFEVQDARRIRT